MSHEHTRSDGRGPRQVYLDGQPIYRVLYANTKKGKVRVTDNPAKLHKYGKRVIERTLYGVVTVVPIELVVGDAGTPGQGETSS